MADEREDKCDGMSKAETGTTPPTGDSASKRGKIDKELDDSVFEKCASTWTIEAIERGLTLMSDPISRAFFHDRPDLVEYLIRNVLDDDSIELVDMRQQVVVTNPCGHSAQFDIFARDSTGKIYNDEFQNRNEKAIIQRAFFYASTLFLNEFKAGVEYENSPKVCVIFLVENGKGCGGKLIKQIKTMSATIGQLRRSLRFCIKHPTYKVNERHSSNNHRSNAKKRVPFTPIIFCDNQYLCNGATPLCTHSPLDAFFIGATFRRANALCRVAKLLALVISVAILSPITRRFIPIPHAIAIRID